jgi:hypothetical protein
LPRFSTFAGVDPFSNFANACTLSNTGRSFDGPFREDKNFNLVYRLCASCPGRARGKESSHMEGPEKEKKKQHEYRPNDKWATYSGAKGQSQFPHPLCLVRHSLECDNAA